jgi:phosphohistidine phosphatase
MPKTLYLVRHAKSSWKHAGLDDSQRPLNKRGKHDAPLMGRTLKHRGEIPELIISSPAKRAISTAKYFAEEIGYPENKIIVNDELYFADINNYLHLIEETDDSLERIMLFSHNPGITYFVNYLTGSNIENIPTAGIARIDLGIGSWKDIKNTKGELNFFVSPKML